MLALACVCKTVTPALLFYLRLCVSIWYILTLDSWERERDMYTYNIVERETDMYIIYIYIIIEREREKEKIVYKEQNQTRHAYVYIIHIAYVYSNNTILYTEWFIKHDTPIFLFNNAQLFKIWFLEFLNFLRFVCTSYLRRVRCGDSNFFFK